MSSGSVSSTPSEPISNGSSLSGSMAFEFSGADAESALQRSTYCQWLQNRKHYCSSELVIWLTCTSGGVVTPCACLQSLRLRLLATPQARPTVTATVRQYYVDALSNVSAVTVT